MTILSPAARTARQHTDPLLTAADVLAIERAVVRVAYYGLQPDVQDRQALATVTYWDGWPPIWRRLCERILDGTITLPLSRQITGRLLLLAERLPEVTAEDEDVYFATHEPAWVDTQIVPTSQHAVERPDLAHVPHSITVEPITPGLRRDSDLPAHATLVVVERHAGRLAKVCGTTDVSVADYTEFGHAVTIEALARGIAHTYGATYVEAAAAVTV